MTNTMIAYTGCTAGRGFDFSSKLGGGVGGSFKELVDVSVNLAHETAKKEDTPVALQVVHDCLALSEKTAESPGDRAAADSGAAQAKKFEDSVVTHTPHISLSRPSAPVGGRVTVNGRSFWAHETVDIYLQGALIKQVPVDGSGAFHTSFVVPRGVLLPGVHSSVDVSGESSATTASRPFQLISIDPARKEHRPWTSTPPPSPY